MSISVTCTGNNPDEVYAQLIALAERMSLSVGLQSAPLEKDSLPNENKIPDNDSVPPQQPSVVTVENWWGYRPVGVNYPEEEYSPIDDGTDYTEEALRDWLRGCHDKGRDATKILAEHCVVETREAAKLMGYDKGYGYSGVWNGPRNQADKVRKRMGIQSWPYGHTYEEPRKLWMHPKVAERVLNILNGRERIGPSAMVSDLSAASVELQEKFLDHFYKLYPDVYAELYEKEIKTKTLVQRISDNYPELTECALKRKVQES